jgi:hypothetical protein
VDWFPSRRRVFSVRRSFVVNAVYGYGGSRVEVEVAKFVSVEAEPAEFAVSSPVPGDDSPGKKRPSPKSAADQTSAKSADD